MCFCCLFIYIYFGHLILAKKYNELFPKQGKEKKEGKKGGAERESKKEAPQKKEPKKKEPKVVEEEEDDTPPQSKFVDPYVNLPPR